MNVELLKNIDSSFIDKIKYALKWAKVGKIGVSYASYAAFEKLKKEFEIFLRNNGKLRLLFDLEQFYTDGQIIEEFATIPGNSECKIFIKSPQHTDIIGNYHPKFYFFYNDEKYIIIIGSSNFTLGGLKNNIECNLCIENKKDEYLNCFNNYFEEIWFLDYSLNVLNNDKLIEQYNEVHVSLEKKTQEAHNQLDKIKGELYSETEYILKQNSNILNEDFAYLLGLISGNSYDYLDNYFLVIDLYRQTVNVGKENEGYYYYPYISDYKISQLDAHKTDIEIIHM